MRHASELKGVQYGEFKKKIGAHVKIVYVALMREKKTMAKDTKFRSTWKIKMRIPQA